MPYKDPEKKKLYSKIYREMFREKILTQRRSYWKEQRMKVLLHYSNNQLECKCCGEEIYEFLSIDHINGGGNQHRKQLGSKYIYSWLISNNFPAGYQVLCHSCNMAKAFYKECPHEVIKRQINEKQLTVPSETDTVILDETSM